MYGGMRVDVDGCTRIPLLMARVTRYISGTDKITVRNNERRECVWMDVDGCW